MKRLISCDNVKGLVRKRMLDRFVSWLLEKVVYNIICLAQKRKYMPPLGTSKDNVFYQNVVVNVIRICADYICAIIVWIGMTQRIITYVGLLTMSMYTFAEQYEKYMKKYDWLNDPNYVCLVRQRRNRYLKRYTPNLGCAIFSAVFFIGLLLIVIFEGAGMLDLKYRSVYNGLVIFISVFLLMIKTKYFFLDTFAIAECVFKLADEEKNNI